MRVFAKYLIAAGIFGGEGAAMLSAGIEFAWMNNIFESLGPEFGSMFGMFSYMGIVFLCIGIPSVIVAGILAIVALSKYSSEKKGKSLTSTTMNAPITLATQEYRRAPINIDQSEISKKSLNFCPYCGTTLPKAENLHFCPDCGRGL